MSDSFKGYVAIVTGSSRGIGRNIALKFASIGINVVVCAKSVEEKPNLPGTIYTVKAECENLGVRALAVQCDVRDEKQIKRVVDKTIERFGRIDILVNNAGALWWMPLLKTPPNKFDLVHAINSRAPYIFTFHALPHIKKSPHGRIFYMSPPVDFKMLKNKIGYLQSKYNATMLAMGLADELEAEKSTTKTNAVWPMCMIESFATKNFKLGDPRVWRKADILSDTLIYLLSDEHTTGQQLVTETYLREMQGYDDTDFIKYRCDPNREPPKMAQLQEWAQVGDVRKAKTKQYSSIRNQKQKSLGPQIKIDPFSSVPKHSHEVKTKLENNVLSITLHRPSQKNSFSSQVYSDLSLLFKWANSSQNKTAVVVLKGDSKYFSSGNDIMEWAIGMRNPEKLNKVLTTAMDFLWVLLHFKKVLIAQVQGVAVGIGATILAHCDFVYVSPNAKVFAPFAMLGLSPENCSSILFRERLGVYANELLIASNMWDANRAKECGLVNKIFKSNQIDSKVTSIATDIASLPLESLLITKKLIAIPLMIQLEAAWARELRYFGERMKSPEFAKAVKSFISKKSRKKRSRM